MSKIEQVTEAIRLKAIERGHPVHPTVARHLAIAAVICADQWADDVTYGDLQPRMVCPRCDHRGADVRPNMVHDGRPWQWVSLKVTP